ncbi:hypothetical protein KP509_17G001400 [Ceratopteris richardii]|nr:hypothetical protein KP509_17G001400 [Ceratopteris richardii]
MALAASKVRSAVRGSKLLGSTLRQSSCSLSRVLPVVVDANQGAKTLDYGFPSNDIKGAAVMANFVRGYRRQPIPNVSELDLEEEVAKIDMDPKKMMQPDDPGAIQAVIKDVMPVGYFVSLPSGRDGYLPADDLGFTGGLAVLQRLFKEGQQITVRIVCRGGAGREIVSIKKPEFAPPSEQKTIESLRLHFEQEKKNRMNPRNRRHQNYY